ncbi:hypothetical protein TCAL_07558 [Tigriopus californicus]|uniref:N-acetylglucosaminylphosphatidylinositol deacetylase n=1 Tax=Tigriopus californicus TaxID=6832 RepID=A0A553PP49_TIGCA|nr:N-acetylglucosaminyl-phosphatidylinositol de-N-acetylase-like [Tigriopus californicus]TRY79452.1 hypothetical protein TCAL_07558 [Tigriopus californicus]|eukprot:TCALIF_07558-PA protein Name:"Similar to Pigl N-acetylglucosaminyl-phosphatidylinositol de-N-acetylase (Mus musculus)" AED:0.08 eAED:0.08 QI:744/0.66/0.5/1/1/0.75/4/77/256
MEVLTVALSAILGFCLMFYAFVAYMRPYARLKQIPKAQRVLFVTSHPDDEAMFFGPAILNLCRQENTTVFLLCMSIGNFNNQGHLRKNELYKACEFLGIQEQNILILRYTKLQDNPDVRWKEELISEPILHMTIVQDIDVIVTFDRYGVSGHKNHTSVYNAMALLCLERRLPKHCRVYCLRSVNMLRKYSFMFDLPMSFILSPFSYIASLQDWLTIQKAMASHHSQYVWFRKLYMIFSRYVLINTLDQISGHAGAS